MVHNYNSLTKAEKERLPHIAYENASAVAAVRSKKEQDRDDTSTTTGGSSATIKKKTNRGSDATVGIIKIPLIFC